MGYSREAGRKALQDTVLSRVFLIGIGTILPPIAISGFERAGLFRRFPRIRVPTYLTMIALSLRIALPVSLAPWHWFSPISSNDLEFEIQNRLFHAYDDDDKEVVLYYNRGM